MPGQIDEISASIGELRAEGKAREKALDSISDDIGDLRGNLQKFYFYVEKELKDINRKVGELSTEQAKRSGESKANKHWATLLVAATGGLATEGVHWLLTLLGGKPPPHT